MHFPYNNALLEKAKELRKNMTFEEKKLWYDFLWDFNPRFLRQKIIDSYILDFYCSKARLAVEIDGNQHLSIGAEEHDAIRTGRLNQYGIVVIRFYNDQVRYEFDDVCKQIRDKTEELLNHLAVKAK